MSNILIVYASKYGCTEKCANILSEKMSDRPDLCNLKDGKVIDLANYDKIMIGGSIYAGKIQKEVTEFCSKYKNELCDKKLGFFICGMSEDDAAMKQLGSVYPQELLDKASAKENFGSQLNFKKMNFMEKVIIKKITKKDSDYSNILENNIDQFAKIMNEA